MFHRHWAEGRPAVADGQAPPVLAIDHTGAPNGLTACGRMGRKRASGQLVYEKWLRAA
jgi:hypothetical protein